MPDGKLVVAVGASRSGKTAWVKQQLQAKARCLVWDVEGQYVQAGFRKVTTAAALVAAIQEPGPLKIAFVPRALDQFAFFCKAAWVFARQPGHKAVGVEELADVTTPAKAPDGWGILVRRGLKYDCDIFAITQRPAESDKTIMGNASVIHCCRLQRAADRKYVAAEMDVPVKEIETLQANPESGVFEYLERDMRTRKMTRQRLKF